MHPSLVHSAILNLHCSAEPKPEMLLVCQHPVFYILDLLGHYDILFLLTNPNMREREQLWHKGN